MALQRQFKYGLLALFVSVALTACDGDDGTDGVDGAAGAQGPQGEQGPAGDAGADAVRDIQLEVVGRFNTTDLANFNAEDNFYGKSAAEIVQYHSTSQSAFAQNGAENRIEVISLANLPTTPVANPVSDDSLSGTEFSFPETIDVDDGANSTTTINLGDVNSLAIYGDMLALAITADTKTDNGAVLFYTLDNAGQGTLVKGVQVGALPDMVTFTPDGAKVLVANEGEPLSDYSVDPEGSISIIDVVDGVPADTASNVNFTTNLVFKNDRLDPEDYDTEEEVRTLLSNAGVKLSPAVKAGVTGTTTVAQDLEPEYIAVSSDSSTAYVALQESNALAIVDLGDMEVQVKPLGFKDWSEYSLDVTNRDELPSFVTVDGLYGMYQPDSIATYEYQGVTFVLTANEGDSRDYDGYSEEVRAADIVDPDELGLTFTAALQNTYDAVASMLGLDGDDALGRLKVTTELGDSDGNGEYEALYSYGARSFSIFDQNANLVFDSGDDFDRISAAILGDDFNSTHTENKGDNRSDDKGGEPEAIAVGTVNDRTYAFVGLERSGDLFVYDVTSPFNVSFVTHYNNRDFSVDYELDDDLDNPCDTTEGMDCSGIPNAGDLGPESINFVAASDSPNGNPLLIIGNEVSGTVTVYQVTEM